MTHIKGAEPRSVTDDELDDIRNSMEKEQDQAFLDDAAGRESGEEEEDGAEDSMLPDPELNGDEEENVAGLAEEAEAAGEDEAE